MTQVDPLAELDHLAKVMTTCARLMRHWANVETYRPPTAEMIELADEIDRISTSTADILTSARIRCSSH